MDKFLRPERLDSDPSATGASKEFSHWLKTFENFVAVIPAVDDQRVDRLSLLTNFVSPRLYQHIEECVTYDAAVAILKSLFIKPSNEVYARHILATRRQQSGESLDEYLQVLRNLSKECNFRAVSANQYRDEYVRDSFISGLASATIRQRLLENNSLELQEMVNQARALETAQLNSQSYISATPHYSVSAASDNTGSLTEDGHCIESSSASSYGNTKIPKCYFCGFGKHPRSKCPAKDLNCSKCSKKGHFARVCRSNPGNTYTTSSSAAMEQTSTSSDTYFGGRTPTLASVVAATHKFSKSIVEFQINGIEVKALIDSGSEESFIHPSIVDKASLRVTESGKTISMATASLTMKTLGMCYASFQIGSKKYSDVKFSVLPNLCADLILGQDFQSRHEYVTLKYGGSDPPLTVCGLSTIDIEAPDLFANLTADCYPIAAKSRKYSVEDQTFIGSEIDRLMKEDIIEPSCSPWRAQVVVTKNENHKKRMVIDYSTTINRFTQLDAYPLPKINDLVSKIAQFTVFSTIDLQSAYHQVKIKDSDRQYTAFEANRALYQFLRLPFGVTNVVACFQRIMDNLVKEEKLNGVFPYLDDITICGEDQVEHDENLKSFVAADSKRGLTCNYNKCTFSKTKINLLGYQIENGQIRPDPERMLPLLNLPVPNDKKSLQRVMGFFSYYSSWIPKFSETIRPLVKSASFPLSSESVNAFETVKNIVAHSVLVPINEDLPFLVETDASDSAIAATLSQSGRPVAFFSRTLHGSELHHAAVEKEAKAVVEAIRHWKHFLTFKHFTLKTDQQSVAYMFNNKRLNKIKNDQIMRWRMELSCYRFDIEYRPGNLNVSADTLTRTHVCSLSSNLDNLLTLHKNLSHPGITRLYHFVRAKNLPYSLNDIKQISNACSTCSQCKPRFFKPDEGKLIKATQPFERLNLDFKGPLPSNNQNKFFLIAIDEYSRFPFVFPCSDITSATVVKCLSQLFVLFGIPSYIHSDRGTSFLSKELCAFLQSRGIASSRTTCYNPQGNGLAEKYNSTVWKAITLSLHDKQLPISCWQEVLPDVLHSIRSLLCTATNCTPHERFFGFCRRSTSGITIPTWLTYPGAVLLKRFVRNSKTDPLVDEVQLLQANPQYAHIRHADGREATVSLKHLAPKGTTDCVVTDDTTSSDDSPATGDAQDHSIPYIDNKINVSLSGSDESGNQPCNAEKDSCALDRTIPGADETAVHMQPVPPLRRSQRISKPPNRLNL